MISYMKKGMLLLTFAFTLLFISSCTDTRQPDDTKEIAEDQNEEKFDNNKQEKDAQFLVNAAEINLEEIQLGQLAQQKGTSAHVKELGKMMEDGHSKTLGDLTALAQSKMITIPNAPTENAQDAYNNLNAKSGSDFDKAFSDRMVEGHKDAIDIFEKASENCSDTDIKNWATATLPALRGHLEHSIDCQKKSEKL
jgi:putative membrane protein